MILGVKEIYMNIEICLHRQLKANTIYPNFQKDEKNDKTDPSWDELYSYFQNNEKLRNAIYFYHYGNSEIPFYIGKSTATSYNILGRVWQEIEDYAKGKYWFPKDVTKLTDANCFMLEGFSKDNFWEPPIFTGDKLFVEQIGLFLSNVCISFSYITSLPEDDPVELVHFLETYLQKKMIEKLKLKKGWIGDAGSNFTTAPPEKYKDSKLKFIYEDISIKLDEKNFK